MTTFQKVIKYLAMAFAIFLTVSIIEGLFSILGLFGGFFGGDAVADDIQTDAVSSDIRGLEVNMSAADFTIRQGEKFLVESNLKHLTVEDKNGVLSIQETKKFGNVYNSSLLTLYIPTDAMFEKINIKVGAGKITIADGELHDLDLDMGIGQLNLISELTGDCSFDLGVGESNITVIGERENYKLSIEKGIGSVTVDGEEVSNLKE